MDMSRNFSSSGGVSRSIKPVLIVETLKQTKESFERQDWKKHIIYRVPWGQLGQSDHKAHAFRPRIVSIGPYHYGDPRLERMQKHKFRLLHCIQKRTGKDINELLDVVRNLEHEARACYQDLSEESFPSDVFVEMLLLDACLILEFLVIMYNSSCTELGYDEKDPIFSKAYARVAITADIMLLENQIPILILERLYEVLFNHHHNDNEVADMMLALCGPFFITGRELTRDEGRLSLSKLREAGEDMRTCLEGFWHHLMYDSHAKKYSGVITQDRANEVGRNLKKFAIPSVTALKEAGVSLRCKHTTPFWDIEFNAGILKIPQIMICELSESVFLNLMAFELWHLNFDKHKIIPYVVFMDSLVNSASDVAELRRKGVIVCAGPSDEEVASLFNGLGKQLNIPVELVAPSEYFLELSRQLYEHCNKRRHRWRANLMRNYFHSPWAIISVIAAVILLLLTIVQTYYTIGQYYET